MILHIHTDALYIVEPGAKSQAVGYFFLTNYTTDPTKAPNNLPICVVCQVLKNVPVPTSLNCPKRGYSFLHFDQS